MKQESVWLAGIKRKSRRKKKTVVPVDISPR